MTPECLEYTRMDARTLLILVCAYALTFSYPLKPGCGKQHGDHVSLQYGRVYLFSLRRSSAAKHLLHSDFPPEMVRSELNTTDNKQHKKRKRRNKDGSDRNANR